MMRIGLPLSRAETTAWTQKNSRRRKNYGLMAPSHHREHPFGFTVLLAEQNVRQTLAMPLLVTFGAKKTGWRHSAPRRRYRVWKFMPLFLLTTIWKPQCLTIY